MTGSNLQSSKYVIIHGHFYQPPRENPWIDLIEEQPSAAPIHDWNERVYMDCYRPNAYSRLLDSQGMITDIHNNFLNMSFNYGPTLFSWLEHYHPVTAQRVLFGDAESQKMLNGHGNAVAQVFNHIIMPLASRRDQLTQIRWAKRFFQKRFNRNPEGFWLAETAINMQTVFCLIEEGIKFVILSPTQADSFRHMQGDQWTATSKQPVDTRRPYRLFARRENESGDHGFIDVFFFDEGLSKEVSFGDLLIDANKLGDRINACYDPNSRDNQAVVIATDGETFGHHKPFGDMCLAYFFKHTAAKKGIIPVNFGCYLEMNQPQWEVTLKNPYGEGSAWSCAHGVGRWVRDCGCKTGGKPNWKQQWRGPLRMAFEKLQKKIDAVYEKEFSAITDDPWKVRDDYIDVQNVNSWRMVKQFLERHCKGSFTKEDVFALKRLLEAQKYMIFSFTSCAWFFSDISGIETVQNMLYACRALQLGIPSEDRETVFAELMEDLGKAQSNLPETNGRTLVEKTARQCFGNEKIIAFTAAARKVVGIERSFSFREFRYDISMDTIFTKKSGMLTYESMFVSVENQESGELSKWAVLISHRSGAEFRGWVLDTSLVTSSVRNLMPDDWIYNSNAVLFTYADIFLTSRKNLEHTFLHRITKDTENRFNAWMRENIQVLDSLARLDTPIPGYFTEPLAFVFKEQWTKLIGQLEGANDEEEIFGQLLDLWNTAEHFQIKINVAESAKHLENMLVKEMNSLLETLEEKVCDRLRMALNIVDRFSVPVSKHRLEDIFQPLLYSKVKVLHSEVIGVKEEERTGEKGRKYAQKRELLIRLVSFARRMNFNTDLFQITGMETAKKA